MGLQSRLERAGIATSRMSGHPVMFHRLTVKLSRKFRVWLVPGDVRFIELDPVEFSARYRVSQEYKVGPLNLDKAIEMLTAIRDKFGGNVPIESHNKAGDLDYVTRIQFVENMGSVVIGMD